MSYRLEEVNFDPFAGAQQQPAGVTLEPVDFDPFAPKQEPPAPEEDNLLPAIGRGLEKGGLMLAQTASEMATTMPGTMIKSGIAESERIEPLSLAGAASAFPTFRPLAKFLPGYQAGGGLEPTRPAFKKTLDETGDILLEAGKTGREFYDDIRKDVDQTVPESRRGKDFIDDPGLLLNPAYLAEASVESIVSMVPPLVAAFAGGGPAVAGAIGGGMEGLGALGEMVDDGMQPDEALVRSGAYGMASAALNAYSFDKILSKQVADGLVKKGAKILGAAGVEAFTEWLEGPVQAIAKNAGTLPMVQEGSTVGQSASRGLDIARTGRRPQDMVSAVVKAGREEAAVIPGAFIAGGGSAMIAPSEGGFTFSEEDKGGQTRRKLESNEPVDLLDAAPKSDQGQPAVDPRIQAKRQALMNAFADLQRQAQAQAEMPTTPDQQIIEQQVGIGQAPARPAGYYEQPIIGQEQVQQFEQGLQGQPGPVELYPVDDLGAEWNARMAEQDAMNQQARLEAEWKARSGQQPFGGLQMPRQESAPSSPAAGNIPGQQARGLQRGTASPALTQTMVQAQTPVDQKAHEAATSPLNDRPEPTEAQKQAGVYKKGHVKLGGLDISIENPAGSVRSGTDAQGREWQTEMKHHYGYIRGTKGADKDHVDVFLAPGAEAGGPVFVVNQVDPKTGKFDEHKAIIGAANEQEARDIYLANYEDGWQGLGSMVQMSFDGFKKWAKTEKTAQPAVGDVETSADLPGAGTVTAQSQGVWSEKQTAKQEKKPGRTANDYTVETEDFGTMGVRVIRSEDGSVTIFTDNNTITHNSDFASGKSDEDLLAYSFEPYGFKGASRVENALDQKTKKPVGDISRQQQLSPAPDSAVAPPSAVDEGAISKADRPSAKTVTATVQAEASAIERREQALQDLDALRPNIADDKRITSSPNVVLMNVRDMQEREVTKLAAPYDGTREDALRVARLLRLHAAEEYDASMRQSETFGTDEQGRPVFAFRQGEGDVEMHDLPRQDAQETPQPRKPMVRQEKPKDGQATATANQEIDALSVLTGEAELSPEQQAENARRYEAAEADIKTRAEASRQPIRDEIARLEKEMESLAAEARKWAAKQYKDNKTKVTAGGKDEFDATTTKTIGEVNEGRRSKAVQSAHRAYNDAARRKAALEELLQGDGAVTVDMNRYVEGRLKDKEEPVKFENLLSRLTKEKKEEPAPVAGQPEKKPVVKAAPVPALDRAAAVRHIAALPHNLQGIAAAEAVRQLGLPVDAANQLLVDGINFKGQFTQEDENAAVNALVPTPQWIKINRDKTVEADIPEAAKEKLTLKQQKAWLLAEIDKAMKSDAKGGKPFEFHVPGDGHFRVKAEQLAEFKKRVEERFPEKERPSALGKNPPRPTQSSRGRITEGEYYNEWQDNEVKIDAIFKPEDKDSPFPAWDAKTSVLHNGVALVVLPKKPMLKGVKENKADVESFLKHSAKEISERAEIVGQFKRAGLSEEDESRRLAGDRKTRDMLNEYADNMAIVFAHVRYGDKDAFFHADKIDMLRTQYPDAEIRVSKDGTKLGAFVHGKVVGIVMGVEGVELSDYHKARIEEIAAAKEGRTPKVKAADAKVETKQPVAEEVEIPVAETAAKQDANSGMRKATKAGQSRVDEAKKAMAAVVNNPDIVGKDRADRIENARNLVHFLETNAANDLDTGYENGDMVAYTGEDAPEGMRAFIYLEGAKAGKTGVAATKEARAERDKKAQEQWQKDQEGFRRIREAQQQPATKSDAEQAKGDTVVKREEGKGEMSPKVRDGQPFTLQEARKGMPFATKRLGDLGEGSTILNLIDYLVEIKSKAESFFNAPDLVNTDPPSPKGLLHSVPRDAKFLRNIIGREPFRKHGFGGLDAKTQGLVLSHVDGLIGDKKILDTVVRLIPIDVVDNLASKKISPEVLFNNAPMLKSAISGKLSLDIASGADVSRSILESLALARAIKESGFTASDLIRESKNGISADTAINLDAAISSWHKNLLGKYRGSYTRLDAQSKGTKETDKGVALYQSKQDAATPSPLDIRAAFPWADSIVEDGDGRTIITKGKNSFAVTKVEQITPDEVSFRIQYKRAFDPKTDKIAGDYREGEIRLSRVADKWTLMHEYEHALEDMGLINKMEQAILDAAAKKAGYDMAPSENRAYYVQDQLEKREFDRKTPSGRILQKIADMVDSFLNLFTRTARGIVRDVESGRMMERPTAEQRKFLLPMLQAAYHGSPHRFDKFTLDAMGTGEGAQAYGWGLYFAGKKEVAEFYRTGLSTPKETVTFENSGEVYELADTGEWVNQESGHQLEYDGPEALAATILSQGYGLDNIREMIRDQDVVVNSTEYKTKDAQEALAMIEAGDITHKTENGQLYKVEIPEDDVMLHWDRPLSEQPEKVRGALDGVIWAWLEKDGEVEQDAYSNLTTSMTGSRLYNFDKLWEHIDFMGALNFEGDKSVSEYLNSIGIKGIKYLDGSSRSQGEGSYNYVIFDDSAIEVLETYYQVRPASQSAHYQLAGMNKVNRLIQAVAYRPETFGRLNFIHTQMDKALRSPQFKMVFNRISEMARTVSSSASSAASLAEDILPSPDKGFKATVKDIFDAGRFTDKDLRETSVALSAGSLAGDSPSPFDGKVFTDDELLNGVEVHGKTYRLTPEQVEAYRQTRAAVNKSVWDLATSEAWKRIRPFVDPGLWQVFADNSAMADVRMEALMYDALDQAERDAKAAEKKLLAQAGVRDLEELAAHEKELKKFIRKMRTLVRDMKKAEQSEDAMEKIEAIEEKMDRLESEYGMSMDDAIDDLKALRAVQKTHKEAVKKVANIEGTIHDVFEEDGVFDKARRLQAGGYMPLMRFGTYEIRVEDEDGKGVAMYRFDSSTEAKLAYDDLVAQYGGQQGVTITRPVKINTEAWKRFKDVNPDSILLFAKESDFGADQAMQEVYRKLYSDRSSMKRLIRRKGVPGYSDDLQRILSSFITSNARRVAANYHSAPVEQMITDIGNNDVQQEAQKVFEFFQSSGDPGSAFRSFAAHLRLLGSPMTAAINGTQVFTSTFPELVKHGATTTEALGRIFRAYRDRFKKDPASMTPDEEWAIARGVKDGTIDSAEIFHLYGMGTQTLVDKMPGGRRFKRSSSAALRARGMAFAWAEKLNRHVTLLAAFRMFSDQGMSREDAYQKAREVVDITQGRYGKENRPNLGRNPIAGAMLTFMQYKIMTLEQIVRNAKGDKQAKKAAALQILILMMLGGLGGAPFAEDAMDLLDIIMQALFGRAWLSKNKAKKAVQGMSESAAGAFVSDEAAKMFGKFAGEFFEKGVSGLPGMPLDVSGRYRMGGTIPGLKLLKPSTQYRDSAVFDMFGVPGGMVDDAVRAIGLALDGEPWRGAQLWLPSDVQNFAKGLDIAATGKIRDTAGRLITEGNMLDASLQALGAQPRKKSAITSPLWEKKEILALTQKQESAFLKRYVEAIMDGDEAAAKEVLDDLAAWNKNNPDWPIRITKMQVKKAMQDMAMTKEQRQLRMAPKEVRKNFVPGAP